MIWTLIKGGLIMAPIFIIMGIVGNIIGAIALIIFLKLKGENINRFLKLTIYVSYFIGGISFIIMGMFYSSFTLFLIEYMPKWFAVIIILLFLSTITKYTFQEIRLLHSKNILLAPYEFFEKEKFLKQSQVVSENILIGVVFVFPAYIFFLIFNDLADSLSFGLNSFLISLIK